jgi:hypothetical protein
VPLIGYARISTEDQTALPQVQELRSAGCVEIHEEQASGGSRTRPVLARVLDQLRKGDTLVVVRIDRLARSLSHLLEVIERLEAKGAISGRLQDPIDTSSPQGKFTLQVLGAAAEFERALIRERTKAGLRQRKAKGRVGGNPGLAPDPAALRKVGCASGKLFPEAERHGDRTGCRMCVACARAWLGKTCCASSTAPCPASANWTQSRLIRAAKTFVRDGFCRPRYFPAPAAAKPTTACPPSSPPSRAQIPKITLQAICTGWRRCASARPAGGQAGSRHR